MEISTSIITSKPRENTEILLQNLAIEADMLVCGNDYRYGKPDPRLFHKVFSEFNIESKNCIYVGDMIFDLQFAINADVDFIHFDGANILGIPSYIVNRYEKLDSILDLKDLINNKLDSDI